MSYESYRRNPLHIQTNVILLFFKQYTWCFVFFNPTNIYLSPFQTEEFTKSLLIVLKSCVKLFQYLKKKNLSNDMEEQTGKNIQDLLKRE